MCASELEGDNPEREWRRGVGIESNERKNELDAFNCYANNSYASDGELADDERGDNPRGDNEELTAVGDGIEAVEHDAEEANDGDGQHDCDNEQVKEDNVEVEEEAEVQKFRTRM